jgi:hypothetical protein
MSGVPLTTLYENIRNNVANDELAHGLLVEALDALELPIREIYSAEEVVALGTYLVGIASRELSAVTVQVPEASRQAAEAIGPLTDVLRTTLLELAHEHKPTN